MCALLTGASSGNATILRDDVLACARAERVHLLLGDRLAHPALTAEVREAAALDAARGAELCRVLDVLATAGVEAILIKGAALAHTHYPSPALRPRLDTDLMIRPDHRAAAEWALGVIGYTRPIETDGDLCTAQFHVARRDAAGIEHALDVHWRVSNVLAFADVLTYDDLASEAVSIDALGPHAFAPSSVHSLVLACIHRVAHHRESTHLLWLQDIHLLAESLSRQDQATLHAFAESRRVRAVCAAGLLAAGQAFVGVAVDLAARIAPPAGTREPTSMFLGQRLRPVDILTTDIQALHRWSERLQLVRELLFPPREYMVARYGMRRPFWLPFLYVRRFVLGTPKWFRS